MIRVRITEFTGQTTEELYDFRFQAISRLYLMGFILNEDNTLKHLFTGAKATCEEV